MRRRQVVPNRLRFDTLPLSLPRPSDPQNLALRATCTHLYRPVKRCVVQVPYGEKRLPVHLYTKKQTTEKKEGHFFLPSLFGCTGCTGQARGLSGTSWQQAYGPTEPWPVDVTGPLVGLTRPSWVCQSACQGPGRRVPWSGSQPDGLSASLPSCRRQTACLTCQSARRTAGRQARRQAYGSGRPRPSRAAAVWRPRLLRLPAE